MNEEKMNLGNLIFVRECIHYIQCLEVQQSEKYLTETVMYIFVIYLLYYDNELKKYFSKNLHTGEKN